AAQAAGDLPQFDIQEIPITPTKHESHGDYACAIALGLAKTTAKKPRDIAEIITKHLPRSEFLVRYEIAGPGYINVFISADYLKQQVEAIIAEGENLFTLSIGSGQNAQVEFVSANPSGPVTLGHTRNAVVGDAMARLMRAAGYNVQREYYFNNAGNQMVKLGQSLQARYLQELGEVAEIPEGGYKGEYLKNVAKQLVAEKGGTWKQAGWEIFKEYAESKMFEWIKQSLDKIDIHHDAFFNEDSLFQNGAIWEVMEELDQRGYIYKAIHWHGASEEEIAESKATEPATWFRSTAFGDTKDRILVKSDGVPTYTLPDIAYHKNKLERGFDAAINVLGGDHFTEAQVVRRGILALELNPDPIHVIIIQMVHAVHIDPVTGEKVELKESKREGTFTTLDELIELTGTDPIRYYMLERSPNTQLTFDLDEAVKQTNENPVYYIQNAYVRCCGIFREAAERGISDEGADLSLLGDDELRFIRKALELGEVIESAVTNYEPHKIAHYAYDLAAVFHPIYDKVRVLHSEVPADMAKARLRFYRAAKVVFHRVLRLMGMSTPERM
ncbi:MAG: arginine--tRNA ligase, partial [Chloroflexi bacterium]|nr:arginine--tRNA ligase [Chloroflexota bacterium]